MFYQIVRFFCVNQQQYGDKLILITPYWSLPYFWSGHLQMAFITHKHPLLSFEMTIMNFCYRMHIQHAPHKIA